MWRRPPPASKFIWRSEGLSENTTLRFLGPLLTMAISWALLAWSDCLPSS